MSSVAAVSFGNGVALPVGAVSSLALHGVLAAAVLWAITPPERAPQRVPQSELSVEAYEVPRSEAAKATPEADAAREDRPEGEMVGSGAVPLDRAAPQPVAAESAAPAAPAVESRKAETASGESAEAAAPKAQPLKAAAAPRDAAASAEPRPETASVAAPLPEAVEAGTPTGEAARAVAPEADGLRETPPPAELAAAAPPASERASEAQPEAADLAEAAPPAASPAVVAQPAPAPIAAVAARPTEAVAAAVKPAHAVAAPVRPAPAASAALPSGPALAPAPAEVASAPRAEAPREAAPPAKAESAKVPETAPPSAPAESAAPEREAAASSAPARDPAPAAPPPAEHGKAVLAPLGPDGTLDAKSLEALAALAAPADPGSAAAELQDGLLSILTGVPCARIEMIFDPDTGEVVLRGNIPDVSQTEAITAGIVAQIGSGLPLKVDLRELPPPQCGVLSGLDAVGLPQSTEQNTNEKILGSGGFVIEQDYKGGEPLNLDLQGADYPAYIYVDFYTADGQVLHLIPNSEIPLELVPAKARYEALRAKGGRGPLGLQFGPPYGREIAVAYSSSAPLYDGLRPLSEPADNYLRFLAERVAATKAATPDFKGEWVYFLITSHE